VVRFDGVEIEEIEGQERAADVNAERRLALNSKAVHGEPEGLEHCGMSAARAEEVRL